MKWLKKFRILVLAVVLSLSLGSLVFANYLYIIALIPSGTVVGSNTAVTGGTFLTSVSPGGGGNSYLDHCTAHSFQYIVGNMTTNALAITVQTSSDGTNWANFATANVFTSTTNGLFSASTVGNTSYMHQYVRTVLTPASTGTSYNTTVTLTCRD